MDNVRGDVSRAIGQLFRTLGRAAGVRIGFAVVFIVFAGILAAAPPALIGQAVDGVLKGKALWDPVIADLLLLLGASLIAFEGVQFARKFLIEDVAVRLQADAQLHYADTLLQAPVDQLQRRPVGEIITLIDKGVTGLVKLMKLLFLEFGPAASTAIIAVVVVMNVHWQVAAVMAAVLGFNFGATVWQIHSQRGIRLSLLRRRSEFNAQVGELIQSVDSVRASGVAGMERAGFRAVAEAIRSTEFRHHRAMMGFDALKGLSDAGGLVAVMVVALVLCAVSEISAGDILKTALLYQNAVVPLRMLHRVFDESHEAAIQISEANRLAEMGVDPGLKGRDGFALAPAHPVALELANLSFAHSITGQPLLDGLQYTVPRGTFDIVLGKTGTGKTTLLRIVLGLSAHYRGSARLFGTEIKSADKDELSRQICYVAQDPFIRSGDLRSNLLLGLHREVTDDELVRAAILAGLDLGHAAWADGLDQPIAERGRGLAGGERQRIALARLFLSEADLLILDEATSQLDEPMEAFVLANLSRLSASKSIIMVAHRRTTLKWAKRCYRLTDGKLIQVAIDKQPEAGSYEPAFV